MPTISELPLASSVSAADEVPISQGGMARAISVGALLASTQPEIIVGSPSLLGRTSLGSGGPEQVSVGTGLIVSDGTLIADGQDHTNFPATSGLATDADVIISQHGSPMRMRAALLRGLFTGGQNVAIDSNGVISSTGDSTVSTLVGAGSSIGALPVVTALSVGDLVPVSHSGSHCAIAYSDFIGGVTIDQARTAGPVADSDSLWVAQGNNIMSSQNFNAIWVWVAKKLATYRAPVVEIMTDTNLDVTVHNGRLLICSQPVTLTPLVGNMGSGFECTVVNASSGSITLGSGFVSSTGNLQLAPWQSATLSCATYSAGTIAFAAMPSSTLAPALPGQVVGVGSLAATSTTITVSWQIPSGGGVVSSYVVQSRPTGTTSWNVSAPVVNTTTFQLIGLQAATSYDIVVAAQNSNGVGPASAVLTALTASDTSTTVPTQVVGLAATPTSSSAIQLSWTPQQGLGAATSFTVQYRVAGSSSWTSSITGIVGNSSMVSGLQAATSYDFSVAGVNNAGAGPASSIMTASTRSAAQSVSSITWNLLPNGTYTHASGSIGVNAHVTPAASPIQFGFSGSASTPPSSWTAALLVNTDLWGAYVPTPATAGSWYTWAAGLDGSATTVSPTPFQVQ